MAKWFALVGWMVSALLLMVLVVRGVSLPFPAAPSGTRAAPAGVQISNSRTRGNPEAKVTLVEYGDFQ